MKKLVLFGLLLSFTLSMYGQLSLTINQNPIEVEGRANDFEAYTNVFITNNSSETKTFTWTRDEVNIPDGWGTGICDINQCYLTSVNSAQFELAGGQTGLMAVHVYPNGVEGEGRVEVMISDDSDAANFINLVQNTDITPGTTSTYEIGEKEIKLFPNPTSNSFRIDSNANQVDEVIVYNILGKEMKRFSNSSISDYYVGDLPKGLFLVQFIDSEKNALNTVRLQVTKP